MDLDRLTLEELIGLNKMVCDAITRKRAALASTKITTFEIGDKVQYAGSGKMGSFVGTVMKVLRVNVDVMHPIDKRVWRINASALTKVVPA